MRWGDISFEDLLLVVFAHLHRLQFVSRKSRVLLRTVVRRVACVELSSVLRVRLVAGRSS